MNNMKYTRASYGAVPQLQVLDKGTVKVEDKERVQGEEKEETVDEPLPILSDWVCHCSWALYEYLAIHCRTLMEFC
jgi:hypothetical protein